MDLFRSNVISPFSIQSPTKWTEKWILNTKKIDRFATLWNMIKSSARKKMYWTYKIIPRGQLFDFMVFSIFCFFHIHPFDIVDDSVLDSPKPKKNTFQFCGFQCGSVKYSWIIGRKRNATLCIIDVTAKTPNTSDDNDVMRFTWKRDREKTSIMWVTNTP